MTPATPTPPGLFERISPDVLHVLTHQATFDTAGTALTLRGTLDRTLYAKVDEVLGRLGGKWQSKTRVHAFPYDARGILQDVLASGLIQIRNPTAFFPTPPKVSDMLLSCVELERMTWREHLRILEPSAGQGALLDALRPSLDAYLAQDDGVHRQVTVHACELLPSNRSVLRSKGYELVGENFLDYHPGEKYDLIVMNPPFSVPGDKNAWVTHLMHAWSLLADRGRLVAILPDALRSRTDRAIMDVYGLAAMYGHVEEIGRGAFKESGTDVNTLMLTLDKEDAGWRRQPVESWTSHMSFNASLVVDCDSRLNSQRYALAERAAKGDFSVPEARQKVRAFYQDVQERERQSLSLIVLNDLDHEELFGAFRALVDELGGFPRPAVASHQVPLLAV